MKYYKEGNWQRAALVHHKEVLGMKSCRLVMVAVCHCYNTICYILDRFAHYMLHSKFAQYLGLDCKTVGLNMIPPRIPFHT